MQRARPFGLQRQRPHQLRRLRQFAVAGALLLPFTGGCARLMQSYDLAPNGLTRTEDGWRRMLVAGRGDSVASRIERGGSDVPGDELMRMLYLGTAAHYSGDYVLSNQYLEAAAAVTDDRITKSLSRSVMSLVSSDGVLPYSTSRTERLLIPYYAALNYVALGDMEGAAVEARRLSALLQAEPADASDDTRRVRAAMRVFSGAIFEAGGHRNDALVAYRNAAALGGGVDTSALTFDRAAADSSGSIIVLLEDGFIAHRVEQNLFVWLGGDELNAFSTGGDDGVRTASSVAGRVVERAFGTGGGPGSLRGPRARGDLYVPLPPDRPRTHRRECTRVARAEQDTASATGTRDGVIPRIETVIAKPRPEAATESQQPEMKCREVEDVPYLLKVAWPVYTDTRASSRMQIIAGADTASAAFADLSGAIVDDYGSQVPLIVARTLARGAAKAALTESAKRKASQKNEGLGKLVGLIGNVGNVMLERADTRSWHLLPAGVAIVRMKVPAGERLVSVHVPGREALDLGTVRVQPGGIAFVSHRIW